ncbi:MAG: RNA polymerase sigma factor [Clostridia bacterium]|nr:RNA polymerase sigma factor [Clostridia bacterium]
MNRLLYSRQKSSESGFKELYKAYYQKVYALARTTMKNDAEAEDVLQLTFISAWRNIGDLDDVTAFNTRIQRITLNQCYTMLRKRRIEIPIDLPDDDEGSEPLQPESGVMLPEVCAEKEDLRRRLARIGSQIGAAAGNAVGAE